eukprot:1153427-Pelagomonas_calceolata.AAC.1
MGVMLERSSDLVTRPCLPVLLRPVVRAAAHLALYSTAMDGHLSPKMAVAVHCQSLYLSLIVLRVSPTQSRMLGLPVQGHGNFYPEVGKGISRANELGWFALDQDLVFERTSGKVCHRRIVIIQTYTCAHIPSSVWEYFYRYLWGYLDGIARDAHAMLQVH